MDSSSGPLIWTYIYPMHCAVYIYPIQLEIEVDKYVHIALEDKFSHFVIREWNLKYNMFVIILFFMKLEGNTIASWSNAFWPTTLGTKIWGQMVLWAFLGRSCWRTRIQPHKHINKEHWQLSLPTLLLMSLVNQWLSFDLEGSLSLW